MLDFMILSTQYLLDVEFNKKLSDKNISILGIYKQNEITKKQTQAGLNPL